MDVLEVVRRPYTKQVKQDEEGDYVARVVELPGCVAHGGSAAEALERLDDMLRLWVEDALEKGDPIPEPFPDEDDLPSGKWLQRVPRSLHQQLTALARLERVSLNQLVATVLAEAVGTKTLAREVMAAVTNAFQACDRPSLMRHGFMENPTSRRSGWSWTTVLLSKNEKSENDWSSFEYLETLSSKVPTGYAQVQEEYDYRGVAGLSDFPHKHPTGRRWPQFERRKD